MANIYCTKKLEKILGKGLMATHAVSDDLFGNWNVNIFYLNRRKCLIMVHEETCYCLLFFNVLKKDFANFQLRFYERWIEQADDDGMDFPLELAGRFLEATAPIFLPTNNNRRILGTMNNYVRQIEAYHYYTAAGSIENMDELHMNRLPHNIPMGALGSKGSKYGYARVAMREWLAKK